MSQRIVMSLKTIGILVGIMTGVAGTFHTFAILPYKVEANQMEIHAIRTKNDADHDLLIQIARDTQNIKERLDRREERKP